MEVEPVVEVVMKSDASPCKSCERFGEKINGDPWRGDLCATTNSCKKIQAYEQKNRPRSAINSFRCGPLRSRKGGGGAKEI